MLTKKCKLCGKEIKVKPSRFERTNYCSRKCADTGRKGVRNSKRTEFKKGISAHNFMEVGTTVIRQEARGGKKRLWIKSANPGTWIPYCHYVWESAYGKMPDGLIIHHIDRDTMNDELTNLALLPRGKHLMEHRPEFEEKRLKGLRKKRGGK